MRTSPSRQTARRSWDADVVLAVQPPALSVIDDMKPNAILICFIYAGLHPALVKRLVEKKVTCFAMDTLPRITRAQSMVAQAQQKLYEFVKLLLAAGVSVRFAIHPVAGRMPGQMERAAGRGPACPTT
jgi:NAD/NADP transhydrogenase alpha subunit